MPLWSVLDLPCFFCFWLMEDCYELPLLQALNSEHSALPWQWQVRLHAARRAERCLAPRPPIPHRVECRARALLLSGNRRERAVVIRARVVLLARLRGPLEPARATKKPRPPPAIRYLYTACGRCIEKDVGEQCRCGTSLDRPLLPWYRGIGYFFHVFLDMLHSDGKPRYRMSQ
jgi:hypothetical protein